MAPLVEPGGAKRSVGAGPSCGPRVGHAAYRTEVRLAASFRERRMFTIPLPVDQPPPSAAPTLPSRTRGQEPRSLRGWGPDAHSRCG
jgi:hypothetical protein